MSTRRRGPARLRAVLGSRRVVDVTSRDFAGPPVVVDRIRMPRRVDPNDRALQDRLAAELRRRPADGRRHPDPAIAAVWAPVLDHPLDGNPDLDQVLGELAEIDRGWREVDRLAERAARRSGSISRQFDALLDLLGEWGYVEGWMLTDRGELLTRCYHESDLLITDAVSRSLFDGLDGAAMAALVSTLTHRPRRDEPEEPWFPLETIARRHDSLMTLAQRLREGEERRDLPTSRLPEAGFVPLAYAWAGGQELDDVLDGQDLTGGDFVRSVRMIADVLRQIASLARSPATVAAAQDGVEAMRRGVVEIGRVDGALP